MKSHLKLLITTPNFLLKYDMLAERAVVLESGLGECYGLSWHYSGNQLAYTFSGIIMTTAMGVCI